MNAPDSHLSATCPNKDRQEIYRSLHRGLCQVRVLSRQIAQLAGRDYDKITPLRKIHEQADRLHDVPKLLKNNHACAAGVSAEEHRQDLKSGLDAIRRYADATRSWYWDKESMELLNDLARISKAMCVSFAGILDTDQHAIET